MKAKEELHKELLSKINQVIQDFQKEHPDIIISFSFEVGRKLTVKIVDEFLKTTEPALIVSAKEFGLQLSTVNQEIK